MANSSIGNRVANFTKSALIPFSILKDLNIKFGGYTFIVLLVAITVFGGSSHSGMVAALAGFDPDDPPQGLFFEEWQEIFLGGSKIGYSRNTFRRQGARIITSSLMSMRLSRGPVEVSLESEQKTVETLAGEPLFFQMKTRMGSLPITVEGEIDGEVLRVKTSQAGAGNLQTKEYPWSRGAVMAWGLARETILRGFEAGTEYEVPLFSPEVKLDGPVRTLVKVGELEAFEMRGEIVEGRKVTTIMDFGMGSFESVSWLDDKGRAMKTLLPMGGMQLTLFASEAAAALADYIPADMFAFTILELPEEIPVEAQSVTFSVKFIKPLQEPFSWPENYTQSVLKSESGSALIKVLRANHESLKKMPGEALAEKGLSLYLSGNANINVKDPILVSLAESASGKTADPFEQADRLRKFTGRFISDKSLAVGFASASEVARNPAGDCTEHAVFLAALGRIVGIPSRLAVGLAYLPEFQERQNILGFHMWTQFYLNEQWVDFDAALGESETSPTRIAFYTGALDENSLFDMALPLMKMMGNIEVEIAALTY